MIRHKASGEYMPEVKRRGYTHWNPSTNSLPDTITGCPRLLKSRRQAAQCIVQWAYLPNAKTGGHQSWDGDWDETLDTKPDGRTKEDLEVVEVNIEVVNEPARTTEVTT